VKLAAQIEQRNSVALRDATADDEVLDAAPCF
jgi:hypothetical protein